MMKTCEVKKGLWARLKRHSAAIAFFIVFILFSVWFFLPSVAGRIFPELLKRYAGISTASINLRRISFGSVDAAGFSLGAGDKPFLSADSIRVDFSPFSLIRGKFSKLSVGGGIFRCSLNDGKLTIPGLAETFAKSPATSSPSQSTAAPSSKKTSPLKCPGDIEIRNFILELDIDGRLVRVPLDLSLSQDGYFSFTAMPFEKGEGLKCKGNFNIETRTIVIDSLKLDLAGAALSPLLSKLGGAKLSGILSAAGKISFLSDNLSCDMKADWKGAAFSYSGMELKALPGAGDIFLTIAGSGKSFKAEAKNLALQTGPCAAEIKSFALTSEGKDGVLNFSIPELPVSLTSKLFDTAQKFILSAKGVYDEKNGAHDFSAVLKSDDFSMNAGSGKLSLKSPLLSIVSDGKKTVLDIKSGALSLPGGLAVSSINAKYPLPGNALLKTGMISFSGKDLGRVEVSLETAKRQLLFKGRGTDLAFPGIEFSFTGQTSLAGAVGDTRIDYILDMKDLSVLNPGDFYQPCEGFELKGRLACKGIAAFKPGAGLSLPFSANIEEMRVENKEKKILAENMKLVFFVPDLLEMDGSGRQRLTFQKIEIGNVKLGSGIVLFRMEPQNACFIEKFEAKCSEGSIAFHALKVIPGIPDYRTVLFCDRLKFADVLGQLGIVNGAEGKGTVSGRIPLVYFQGTLSVEDGFLFSSPGDGGRIRLSSPDVLSPEFLGADMANSAQVGNIELARQALTAFDYQWAKLSIRSENDILLIAISMYGKPAKPLLFTYKEELGGYVKVKSEEEGSIFKEMMLEFNFRLPVNKMIGYGNGVWRIFDEFKKLKPGAFK